MAELSGDYLLPILQIIWINILLSGDNAVVIALACRSLPEDQKRMGMLLGAGGAIALRIVFTVVVVSLLELPWLKLVSGALLLWIAVKLVVEDTDEADIKESHNVWHAMRIIIVADAIMSLDNVIAVAAAARGSLPLIIFGLLVSIPIIILAAKVFITLLDKYRWLVWAGAALLGWVSGELMISDPVLSTVTLARAPMAGTIAATIGALGVLAVASIIHWRHAQHAKHEE